MKLHPIVAGIMLVIASYAQAQEIETITVVGTPSNFSATDPSEDFTLIERAIPSAVYAAGGIGGFSGYNERGTQPSHTTVYRNGVPANDAGSGWYDFGHDLATGREVIRSVPSSNGVLYGSGSLGGAVFINDVLRPGSVMRVGEKSGFVSTTFSDVFQVSYLKTNNGSVRTDNTEADYYDNFTAKTVFKLADFTVAGNFTDYNYDYDDCYTLSYQQTNNCRQKGQRGGISVRNDNFTVGYNQNTAKYYSNGEQTWNSKAERYYFDTHETFRVIPTFDVTTGVTYQREEYAGQHQTEVSTYGLANWNDNIDFGIRTNKDSTVVRTGVSYNQFFASVGTGYRRPTLYESIGDSWVAANPDLKPEKSVGYEVGYGPVSFFRYDFSEGINYDFIENQFTNTGKYRSQGVRINDSVTFGSNKFIVYAGYTDSDLPRTPKYNGKFTYIKSVDDMKFSVSYAAMFDRGTDTVGGKIDNVSTFDFMFSKKVSRRSTMYFTIQDILNRRFEIIPGYGAGGRNFYLTLQYN